MSKASEYQFDLPTVSNPDDYVSIDANEDDAPKMRKVYLDGEFVKRCFFFFGSNQEGVEVPGVVGFYLEPMLYDKENDRVFYDQKQGLVRWEYLAKTSNNQENGQ